MDDVRFLLALIVIVLFEMAYVRSVGYRLRTNKQDKTQRASRKREAFFISAKKGETTVAVTVERQPRDRATPWLETSGNQVLIDVLRSWGVTFFAGVNGGGVVHVAKHLEPYTDLAQSRDGISRMLTMG